MRIQKSARFAKKLLTEPKIVSRELKNDRNKHLLNLSKKLFKCLKTLVKEKINYRWLRRSSSLKYRKLRIP